MNQKDILLIVLVLVVIALAGLSYYLYSGANKCKAIATDLGGKLQQCAAGVAQCATGATTCQNALTALKQIPTCAPYLQGL